MSSAGGVRIAVVCRLNLPSPLLASMDLIRMVRIAEALARAGHHVDLVADIQAPERVGPRLRRVPIAGIDWRAYDLVKTELHRGWDVLAAQGGADHPFVISKLGSVVGPPGTPGVYFFGPIRDELEATQWQLAGRARAVAILTRRSIDLWRAVHGSGTPVLQVPTGVDAVIPEPGVDPYRALGLSGRAVLFAGNIYGAQQLEVNVVWQDRLNRLGRALQARGLALVVAGRGDVHLLDRDALHHLGAITVDEVWDWQRGAIAGIVLAHGPDQHNESSKIYSYLRTELPVICERPVPNADLITSTGCGELVDLDDVDAMAEVAADLAARRPTFDGLAEWMVREHSWDERVARYAPLIEEARLESARRSGTE